MLCACEEQRGRSDRCYWLRFSLTVRHPAKAPWPCAVAARTEPATGPRAAAGLWIRDSSPLGVAASHGGVPEDVEPGNRPSEARDVGPGCRRDSCPLAESAGVGGPPENVDSGNRPSEARDVGTGCRPPSPFGLRGQPSCGLPTVAHADSASVSEGWRGRRDSNPRPPA
jgi:hypothetical protein